MKTIETIIIINAPIKDVWAVLTNFSLYHEWSPVINIEGSPMLGANLRVSIRIKKNKLMQFKPSIISFKPESELKWIGKLLNSRSLFVGEHYFKLRSIDATRVELIHGETFTGLFLLLIWPIIAKDTQVAFENFNKSLQARFLPNQ
ncbi:MAG: SRPBCC domain-containing protein [Tatlockia sp.]|nr:SRPBCC domain-containing protein [Tatlockia sp.]